MSRSKIAQLAASGVNSILLTPAADVEWHVTFVHCIYTTSGGAGARKVVLELLDASNNIVGDWHCTPTLSTVSTTYHVEFQQGIYREATIDANNIVQVPFPAGLRVPIGHKLRVRDSANIDAVNDSIDVKVQVIKEPA